MKTTTMVVLAMAMIMSTAGFAGASVTLDNTIGINAGGGNASSDQNQDQNQRQGQQQAASAVIYGNLPEVGFVGFLNPGTPILGTEWKFYYSKLYARLSVKKIDKMRWGFHFLDLMPTKWGGRVQFTPQGESLTANQDDILVMQYWPEVASNPGDEVLGTSIVVGEPDWSDQAFVGEAAKVCKDETMTRRIAISYAEYIDGITVGASIGMSGSTAELDKGTGYVIATGGMVGKNKTRAERVRRVKVLCMNDGPLYLMKRPCPPREEPVVKKQPCPPVEVKRTDCCDLVSIQKRIDEANRAIVGCTRWCFDNMQNREKAYLANIDKFACTREIRYLFAARHHLEKLRQNYEKGGASIRDNQSQADAIMSKAFLDWAVCIRVTEKHNWRKAVSAHIEKYNLDMNIETLPKGFNP